MDGHGGAPVRSRSSQSQSQSPSHSASVSASSSHHKRKFPAPLPPHAFSLSDTGALTSNDDLDSVSARDDSDSEDSGDGTPDDDDNDDNNNAIRTFTNARVNAKPPKAETGKVEGAEKDGRGGVGTGLVVKEENVKGIFTENIQTSGAYSTRDEGLKREEESGRLKFLCYANDGVDEHMIWLIGLKNIFSRQLPNMPKEYIVRLLMDRSHKSMMVIRQNQVVGGITYRPYVSQKFGEIAFCAITADEQVKGYGTRLMNHLKQHARDVDGLTHFLTYADNNAVGYFLKQGFSKEISLEKERWHGYIKDYDGVILMECKIDPKLPYTDLSSMIRRQRQAIDEKIRELSNCHIVYQGIDFQKKDAGIPKKTIKAEDIPGLTKICDIDRGNTNWKRMPIGHRFPTRQHNGATYGEAGWTPDQYGHSRIKNSTTDLAVFRPFLNNVMRSILKMMNEHPDAWPFREPVDARDVPDYYDVIKDPMDLKTMSKRLESEQYYVTFEMFAADMRRMFLNAQTYNSADTIYYKCATRLENFFSSKAQSELSNTAKFSSRGMHLQ